MKQHRVVARIAAMVLLATAAAAAAQTDYPNRPIRMIVPYVPGGGTSVMGRLVAQRLTESWGQQVVVDNRPGAGGIVGAETVARSQPDGYTVMFTAVSDHLLVSLIQKTPYDPIKDFVPVATVAVAERLLVVHPSIPATNLKELIALAKAKPGQINYASLGNGSTAHVGTELLCMTAGAQMTHIPYKGGSQAVTDLLANQVQVYLGSVSSMGPFINAGKLRALAITGQTRVPALPLVPTFAEAGLPGYDVKLWYGILAPAGTPTAMVDKMSAEVGVFVVSSGIKEKLLPLGIAPYPSKREQMVPMMKAELTRYAQVIRAANIKRD